MAVDEYIRRIDATRLVKGVGLLFILALYSPVMQLVLSPVYGSLPSHLFHNFGVALSGAAGWFLKDQIQKRGGRMAAFMLPVLAFWTPTIQYFVLQQSSKLGNPTGPIVTQFFGYYPLIMLTVAVAGKQIQYALNLESHGDLVVEHVPLIGSYILYSFGEHVARAILPRIIGVTVVFTRAGLQFLIAALYAVVIPSKLLLLTIPSIIFSVTSDVHIGGVSGANSIIQKEGYSLLARQESNTGYISVLENNHDGFRVMRCDHSLLGGQWTKVTPGYHPQVEDPIYAVFVMLEAARLVESEHGESRVDAGSKALVIGLGIGTTPAAFNKHGIDTTVVEIDPVVHKFAIEYFNYPSKGVTVIDDATRYVKQAQQSSKAQYDYIVHDVFTGGAEPAELFTYEFLQDLNALLRDDGVIAINYAGDLNLYPTGLIARTIRAIFPTCRIFREQLPIDENDVSDFTNMVFFCKKSSTTPLTFRSPVSADYLGSRARETYLIPKHEIDPAIFETIPENGKRLLIQKEVGLLHGFLDRGALKHWGIMRQVMPAVVWESW
ncbi:hypothetical protein N7539_000082 [Penicillium diatomitis]|uniref:Spermine/spermidine synthase family protein n=1 Tax=Penicillium diatomitis TaxID=2819901 RepID=A0A9X0C200_9EURO|nr:uncharacterized protein N7539_000082 [Penicillium diatomitis]KAJ5494966.1 hypothetical protein N7539_000082 [Penicillium diatomitis]